MSWVEESRYGEPRGEPYLKPATPAAAPSPRSRMRRVLWAARFLGYWGLSMLAFLPTGGKADWHALASAVLSGLVATAEHYLPGLVKKAAQ